MKTIKLKRVSHTELGTFGVMLYKAIPFCVTLELPWKDNIKNISCILEGTYSVGQIDNDTAFDILSVPGRTGIQIEVANTVSQLKGCIAIGESFEPLAGYPAVRDSKLAFSRLKNDILKNENKFYLEIFPPQRREYVFFNS